MQIDKTKPVMLTGATGYLGSHIAKKFIEEGITVHAPIRNPENTEKTKYLEAVANSSSGSIQFFKADLLDEGSYDAPMQGCQLVVHSASPFIAKPKDAQRDLVDPAVNGTANVMQSVQKTDSVKRVVLTSSCAAIYGDAKDTLSYPNQTMTEEQWNTTSSLTKAPYNYSKVLAEKKAWKMTEGQERFDLVTINPSFILGPSVQPKISSESYNIVKQIGDGTMKMGAADINIGCVDVRDVAKAHFDAGFTPSAKGRYITSAENIDMLTLAEYLRPEYGGKYPLPQKTLPKWLIWLLAPMSGVTRQFVKDNIGYPWKADHSKIKKELGFEFTPVKQSINEFFGQMAENGAFE